MTERFEIQLDWALNRLEEAHKRIEQLNIVEFQFKMARAQLICCYITIAALIGLLILEKMK